MARNNPVLLTGPTRGLDGRSVLAKARAPLITDGRIGDFWIDTVSKKLYGPKNAAEWPDNGLIKGDKGWTPVFATVTDGTRRVQQIFDWTGGEGTKPAVGQYVGAEGLVDDIEDAVDFRGPEGPQALINALDTKTGAVTYETLTVLAEDDTDNEKVAVKRLFEPGGAMPLRSNSNASTFAVPSEVSRIAVNDVHYVRLLEEPDVPPEQKIRTADRWTSDGDHDSANGGWWIKESVGTGVYESTVSMPLLKVPESVNALQVNGHYAAGDGGNALYERVTEAPPHAAFFEDAIGAVFINRSREFTPEMLGAVGIGSGRPTPDDNSDRLRDWLLASAYEGRTAIGSGGRTYMIGDPVIVQTDRDIDIDLRSGCVMKGEAGPGNVLRFENLSVRPKFKLSGQGVIENSLRELVPNMDSGTALALIRMGYIDVSGVTLKGASGFGDSGIAAQECGAGEIRGVKFVDQSDIGLYLTGGASTGGDDDWGQIKVIGSYFTGCEIAASARRQIGGVAFIGNSAESCGAGFQCADATSGGAVIGFGKSIVILGNMGKDIGGAFIELRLADGAILSGNTVTNWGLVTASRSAYGLLGCANTLVTGNVAQLKGVSGTSQTAISIGNYTLPDATTVNSTGNQAVGNTVDGAPTGVRDLSGGDNLCSPNKMTGVAVPYINVTGGKLVHRTANGVGIGTIDVQAPFHVMDIMRIGRSGVPAQYGVLEENAGFLEMCGNSDPAAAKGVRVRATTDNSNTPPTGGEVSIVFDILSAIALKVGQNRQIYVPGIGTTASAGNAFLDSGSTPANQLLRSTSSARYKRDIEEIEIDHALEIYERLRAIWYRSTAERDRPDWSWYGLLAEEVAEIDPRLVQWGYRDSDYEDVERWEEVEVVDKTFLEEGDGMIRIEETPRTERSSWTERVLKDGAVMAPDGVQYDRVALVCIMAERHLGRERDNGLSRLEERLAKIEVAFSNEARGSVRN